MGAGPDFDQSVEPDDRGAMDARERGMGQPRLERRQ